MLYERMLLSLLQNENRNWFRFQQKFQKLDPINFSKIGLTWARLEGKLSLVTKAHSFAQWKSIKIIEIPWFNFLLRKSLPLFEHSFCAFGGWHLKMRNDQWKWKCCCKSRRNERTNKRRCHFLRNNSFDAILSQTYNEKIIFPLVINGEILEKVNFWKEEWFIVLQMEINTSWNILAISTKILD